MHQFFPANFNIRKKKCYLCSKLEIDSLGMSIKNQKKIIRKN
jgi:hypothetical protein